MNVLTLVPALVGTSPGQRFRIERWAPYIERAGITLDMVPFEDDALHDVLYRRGHLLTKSTRMLEAFSRRVVRTLRIKGYDAVWLYREAALAGPALIERFLASRGMPLVYDFDDPIWLPYTSPTNGILSRLKMPGKTAAICRMADVVVVGNRLLAEWARQHASRVEIVPSTIDLAEYPERSADQPRHRAVRIVWTGSHSTLPFLDLVMDALERLSAQRDFELVVISHTDAPPIQRNGLRVVGRKWSEQTEAADLYDCDIGIAPFPNHGWTPWRCHGKVLQYMAAGLPVVASNIGILPEYVEHGVSGFLASHDQDWIDQLTRLIDDAALRLELGTAGRRKVEQQFNAEPWAAAYAQILRGAVERREPSAVRSAG